MEAATAAAIPTDNNSETKWPGEGHKKAGKIIALIGFVLMVLSTIGFGGDGVAASVLIIFPLVVLPGWIIYGIGRRKYKKATTPPKIKVDTFAENAKFGLLIFALVIGFIMVVAGIIVLNFPIMILGLILFLGPLFGLSATGGGGRNGHRNARDAFYMNRWGSYQAKKNMRRGYRWSKKR